MCGECAFVFLLYDANYSGCHAVGFHYETYGEISPFHTLFKVSSTIVLHSLLSPICFTALFDLAVSETLR